MVREDLLHFQEGVLQKMEREYPLNMKSEIAVARYRVGQKDVVTRPKIEREQAIEE